VIGAKQNQRLGHGAMPTAGHEASGPGAGGLLEAELVEHALGVGFPVEVPFALAAADVSPSHGGPAAVACVKLASESLLVVGGTGECWSVNPQVTRRATVLASASSFVRDEEADRV
jgi:hypothetical protein